MPPLTFRTCLFVGVVAAIVTPVHFQYFVECLKRLEKLSHEAIPTVLAVSLLYHVLQKVLGRE